MTSVSAELASALRERRAIVADAESRRDQTAHIKRLQAISEKIDQLETRLPGPVPQELAHFLQRRSYDKALAFLEADVGSEPA